MSNSFNNWSNIADMLIPACTEAVDSTAKAGKVHIQDQIKANNQVRTGAMLNSVYASTPMGSDYQGGQDMLPEEKPTNETEAIIGVASDHGIFPELGTVHQAPHPYFSPGMDLTQNDFDTALENLAKKIEEAGK
jgi:HK97 gp10 family phage protein